MTHPHDAGPALKPSDEARRLVERLRHTLQLMATTCSVPMDLWNEHSNAVLEAATALEATPQNAGVAKLVACPKCGKLLVADTETRCYCSNCGRPVVAWNAPPAPPHADLVAEVARLREALEEIRKFAQYGSSGDARRACQVADAALTNGGK